METVPLRVSTATALEAPLSQGKPIEWKQAIELVNAAKHRLAVDSPLAGETN